MSRSIFRAIFELAMLDGNTSCHNRGRDDFPPDHERFQTSMRFRIPLMGSWTLEHPDYDHEDMKRVLMESLRFELSRSEVLDSIVESLLTQAETHCAQHPVRLAAGNPPVSRIGEDGKVS